MAFIRKVIEKLKAGILKEMLQEAIWMTGYIKKYWFTVVFYCLLGVLGTVMGLAGSVASKYLIDVVTGYRTDSIAGMAALMLGLGCGNILMNGISGRISARLSVRVQNEIQADVYDKIMEADWESLHEYRSGDLLNRLNSDVGTVSDSVMGWLPNLLTDLVQFFGALAIILYYDPTMAVIALLSAPVSLVISRILVKKMRYYNSRLREASSTLMTFQEDSFQNLQSIKAFDLVGDFQKKMRQVQNHWCGLMLEYNKVSIMTSAFMSLVGMLVSYACLGWAVYRLWSGAIIFGTLTLFLQLSSNLSSSFSALVGLVPQAISALTCAGRIMKVTELPKERTLDDENVRAIKEEGRKSGLTVIIDNLNFSYKEGNEVLHQVSLEAAPGDIVALVGPSGEGKTTMIRILLGLLRAQSGSVELGDSLGRRCPVSTATRSVFSYVPQGNTMFAGTIADNLRMVKPEATDEEITDALKTACAYSFVEKLPDGIYSQVQEKGVGLSEGQAQRIAIARAVLKDAPVMLFDEATSALDVETERNVLRNLITGDKKKTCIVTAHRPSVLQMCRKVYRVDGTSLTELSEEEASRLAMDF